MKKISTKIILPSTIVLAVVSVSTPSLAFGLSIPNFISSIFNDVKEEYSRLEKEVQQQIDDSWANISTDAKESIQSAIGEMGTPDPILSTQELRERLRNSRSLPETKTLTGRLERNITRAAVNSTLGLEGQQDTKEKIKATTQISGETQALAQQAQSLDASQNILKVLAAQNAQVVSAITRFHADSLAGRQDSAQTNLMLSQVAENLANSTTKEELRTTGQASLTQELVFMSVLDPARE
ncbi:hypothetical protein [Nostoc parmelioides]|uniref:Uncharacterized protein n=1 Tax=Nostoc parmelioides FACHB-3921 TaxID=2692909 RepID=A0ABR8BKW5_9NOSO|nr:hypothetical protein [Nostoc parmelioides]MBD2254743.1 hypothetical protein [Nostoc parmelioides FACHB-3921]